MIFRPKLAATIVRGEKTATRRRINVINPRSPWRETPPLRYPEGKEFAIQPGRGADRIADAVVTRRAIEPLGAMRDEDARREGFALMVDFRGAWREINGGYQDRERVHVIEFKLVGPDCTACGGNGGAMGREPVIFACGFCFGTGVEVTPAAKALIAKLEHEAG